MKYLLLFFLLPATCLAQDIAFEGLTINQKGFITLDFGKVEAGTRQLVEATIINKGDEPLVIMGFKTTCGCTAPQIKEQVIFPAEKSTIGVAWLVHKEGEGPFISYGNITSNAQNYPLIRIKLTGKMISSPTSH